MSLRSRVGSTIQQEHKTDAAGCPVLLSRLSFNPCRQLTPIIALNRRVAARSPMTTPAFFGAPYSEENDPAGLSYILISCLAFEI